MGTDEKSYIKDILGKLEKKGWVVCGITNHYLIFKHRGSNLMHIHIEDTGISFSHANLLDGLYLDFQTFMLFKNIMCNVKSADDLYEIYELSKEN